MSEQGTKNGKLDTAIRLKTSLIGVAGGRISADLVLKNARYVNVLLVNCCRQISLSLRVISRG